MLRCRLFSGQLCPWILCWVRQTLRLVVCYILDAKIFEYFEESLSYVRESYGSVVRIALLDEHVAIEPAHLTDAEDTDATE